MYQAGERVLSGELAATSALDIEAGGTRISAATGNSTLVYGGIVLQAWRGVEAGAMELINVGLERLHCEKRRSSGRTASYAAALLNNGSGRYEAAMEAASPRKRRRRVRLLRCVAARTRRGSDSLGEAGDCSLCPEPPGDAGTRRRHRLVARDPARGYALVSEGEDADALYRQAIDHLDRTRVRIELARAHLLYGEWLRRKKRRIEARDQLRTAHEMFSEIGAEAFTERARRELGATGETARRWTDETRGVLTSQEAQIAQLAQEGFSNPLGAQLFISPRTVQYHLHKVFAKLEITSRDELGRVPERTQRRLATATSNRHWRLGGCEDGAAA